jgi:hypothetical protein
MATLTVYKCLASEVISHRWGNNDDKLLEQLDSIISKQNFQPRYRLRIFGNRYFFIKHVEEVIRREVPETQMSRNLVSKFSSSPSLLFNGTTFFLPESSIETLNDLQSLLKDSKIEVKTNNGYCGLLM